MELFYLKVNQKKQIFQDYKKFMKNINLNMIHKKGNKYMNNNIYNKDLMLD